MVAINKDKRLSVTEIKERFVVEPETGDIFWRERGMGRHIGKPAGTRLSSGYRKVGMRVDGRFVQLYSHQIVWVWCHGKWPRKDIDHINGVKDDNRICNLREASKSQNLVNKSRLRTNASGRKWVCLHKNSVERGKKKVWQASVWFGPDRKQSYFETKDEAHTWAATQAKQLHGEFYNPGCAP